MPPRNFTCFGRLPLEVRFEIWRMAQHPRYIRLHGTARRYRLLHQPPLIRLVNQESRAVALKAYDPNALSQNKFVPLKLYTTDRVYIESDQLHSLICTDYFEGWDQFLTFFLSPECNSRSLVIHEKAIERCAPRIFEMFPMLNELVIIVGKTSRATREKMVNLRHNCLANDHDTWGCGGPSVQEARLSALSEVVQELKRLRHVGTKIPVMKRMVMNPTVLGLNEFDSEEFLLEYDYYPRF